MSESIALVLASLSALFISLRNLVRHYKSIQGQVTFIKNTRTQNKKTQAEY